jgi:hypothetical protein
MEPGTPYEGPMKAWRAERDATRARLGIRPWDKQPRRRLYLPSPWALCWWNPHAAICWFPIIEHAQGIDTPTLALALLEEPERVAAWRAFLGGIAGGRGFPDEGWTFYAWGAWVHYWNDRTLPEAFRRANSTATHRDRSIRCHPTLPPSPAAVGA